MQFIFRFGKKQSFCDSIFAKLYCLSLPKFETKHFSLKIYFEGTLFIFVTPFNEQAVTNGTMKLKYWTYEKKCSSFNSSLSCRISHLIKCVMVYVLLTVLRSVLEKKGSEVQVLEIQTI